MEQDEKPTRVIDVPAVICGRPVWPSERDESYAIDYESGTRLRFPVPNADDLAAIQGFDRFLLHGLHTQDFVGFIARVGTFWVPENRTHPIYRQALDVMCAINGYGEKMAQRELNIVGSVLRHTAAWYDLLEAELGSRFYMDEWVARGDALVHAQPLGRILHVLVGNVPISGIMSLLRGCVTKNQSIGKLAKRDPITTLSFVLSCHELLPDHPITQSLSALYWPAGGEFEQAAIEQCDMVCVWGGSAAIDSLKKRTPPHVEVIEFGPKSSFAVVGRESANSAKVAVDLAHDVALYDQEACFSPQLVFVEGDCDAFVLHLKRGLELYARVLPKSTPPPDNHAHVWRSRLEAHYAGRTVLESEGTGWTIIVIADLAEITEHPLSRVIFVVPVADLSMCVPFVTPQTQTIAMSPWARNVEIRDEATLRGAAKITEIGLVETIRPGATHDGMYPLQRFVRWVCVERGCDHWGKFVAQGPIDTTRWLMMHAKQLEDVGDDSAAT